MTPTRRTATPLLLSALFLLAGAWDVGAQTRDCRRGPGKVFGRVVTSDGKGVAEVIVMVRSASCDVITDARGRFTLTGLPLDTVTIEPGGPLVCVVPRRVRADSAGTDVTFRAVRGRTPYDDAMLTVHGTPWVPPSYAQFHCADVARRISAGEAVGPGAPATPTPDEVLARLLATKQVRSLMRDARRPDTSVPVSFGYGALAGPLPPGPVPYRLDDAGFRSGVYIVVLDANSERLLVQVGRLSVMGKTAVGAGEQGFRLEWRRGSKGWGKPKVVERWSPTPPR